MDVNFIFYAIIFCLVLLATWLVLMELRLRKIFRGKKAGDLEDVLMALEQDFKNLHVEHARTENYLKEVEKRLQKSLKQIGFLRFNPFGDSAANQSFSIAFLDENGNGAVISALYSREGVRTYAKAVKEYKSEQMLTPEEEEAIRRTK